MTDNRTELISLDIIPDPFIILNSDSTILDANVSFASLIGATKENLTGRNIRDTALLMDLADKINGAIVSRSEDFDRTTYNNRHFEVLILPFDQKDGQCFARIVLKDITNFIRLEKELIRRNKELMIINSLSSAFISSENMDMVMEELIEKVLVITDFNMGWLMINDNQNFVLWNSKGISADLQTLITEGGLDDICSDAMNVRDPMYIVEKSVISRVSVFREEGLRFITAIPLLSNRQTIGLLFLASRTARDLDFDFAALLTLVGNHVSHIMDKIKLFQETKRLSITDGLTGLYNSRYFYKYLDLEIARTRRYGSTFSLMLFDIDNFKRLNDTYGHQAGDEVLQELARVLKRVSRETDVVVRYGGEEFLIILPNTSEEESFTLASRILDAVRETKINVGMEQVSITLSGGIASFPKNASTARNLLNAADSAMYSAKKAGKNTLVCYKGKVHE